MFFDTDCAGVVHNIVYLRFIEVARTLLAEAARHGARGDGGVADLSRSSCARRSTTSGPAKLGDQLVVHGWLESVERPALLVRFRSSPTGGRCAHRHVAANARRHPNARGQTGAVARRLGGALCASAAKAFRSGIKADGLEREVREDAREAGGVRAVAGEDGCEDVAVVVPDRQIAGAFERSRASGRASRRARARLSRRRRGRTSRRRVRGRCRRREFSATRRPNSVITTTRRRGHARRRDPGGRRRGRSARRRMSGSMSVCCVKCESQPSRSTLAASRPRSALMSCAICRRPCAKSSFSS